MFNRQFSVILFAQKRVTEKMKKLIITFGVFTLIFASCGRTSNATTFDEGVVINGVRWATSNVDAPGTFAENPESWGMLFQWNRKKGWCSLALFEIISNCPDYEGLERWECLEALEYYIDKLLVDWDSTYAIGTKWYAENDPCPAGWRVPTKEELQKLVDAGSEWATQNGVNGRFFGTAPYQIFLPAMGYRSGSYGDLSDVGIWGEYWSSTQEYVRDYTMWGWNLSFGSDNISRWNIVPNLRAQGRSVRCVAIE